MKTHRYIPDECDCRQCRKSRNREKMIVYGIVWPFMLCALMFSFVVVKSAYSASLEPDLPQLPTWEPPEIPQCDEPLWERIKDRCADAD